MWRILVVALLLLGVTGCGRVQDKMHRLPPLPLLPAGQANSPLEMFVFVPAGANVMEPVKKWLPADSLPVKLYVMVRVKNISDHPVVLPGFCYWAPGFTFTCDSPDALTPGFFRTLNGQIDWIVLKPEDSVYAFDNIATQIAFTRPGNYRVLDQIDIGYSAYTGKDGSESEETLSKEYPSADHRAVVQGFQDIRIWANQVTPNKP